jgi:acyl-CoA synthetase (AMP-forming)/AMP-acid ligase II
MPDGWYRTGDIGEVDTSGALRLVGRTRSLIALPNGMNVHPQDVEAALVAEGLVEPVVYEAEPGRIAFAFRQGTAFSVPPTDEASALTVAVRSANGQLADHQRIAGRAPFPEPDFPRTHTLKVRRGRRADGGGATAPLTRARSAPVRPTRRTSESDIELTGSAPAGWASLPRCSASRPDDAGEPGVRRQCGLLVRQTPPGLTDAGLTDATNDDRQYRR